MDNSTRTRQPHIVLNNIKILYEWGKCSIFQLQKEQRKERLLKRVTKNITFRQVPARHQMHPWDLQTQQKQILGDFGQPTHFSKDHSTRTLFLTLSCFHCSQDYQRKPYSQGDSLCEEDLEKTDNNARLKIEYFYHLEKKQFVSLSAVVTALHLIFDMAKAKCAGKIDVSKLIWAAIRGVIGKLSRRSKIGTILDKPPISSVSKT